MDKPSGNAKTARSLSQLSQHKAIAGTVQSTSKLPASNDAAQGGGPTVLAQPPVPGSEGAGSAMHLRQTVEADAAPLPTLHDVKRLFSDARDLMKHRYRTAYEATDDRVHRNPWEGVVVAALVGIVLGMLAAR